MSDYLWDRSGETDAEVERLEMLLGTLRHSTRPLELPAEAAPSPARRSRLFRLPRLFRPARLFAPAPLAAAAALLLALLLGASAYLRTRTSAGDERGSARETQRAGGDVASERASAPARDVPARASTHVAERLAPSGPAKGMSGAVVGVEKRPGDSTREAWRRKGARIAGPAARVPKGAPPDAGGTRAAEGFAFEAMRAGGDVGAALVESTRLLAKEQLVFALRLTGARLRDVRQRTRGAEDWQSPPDEPERIR